MLSVSVIGPGWEVEGEGGGKYYSSAPQNPTRKYQPAKTQRRVPTALPIILPSPSFSSSSFKWIPCLLLLLL